MGFSGIPVLTQIAVIYIYILVPKTIMLFRVTRIFLAITAHCHDRAAIKIHITHFTRIFNDHFIL